MELLWLYEPDPDDETQIWSVIFVDRQNDGDAIEARVTTINDETTITAVRGPYTTRDPHLPRQAVKMGEALLSQTVTSEAAMRWFWLFVNDPYLGLMECDL